MISLITVTKHLSERKIGTINRILSDNLGNSQKCLELYFGKINLSENIHFLEPPRRGSGSPCHFYLSKSQKSLVKFGRTFMWRINTNSTRDIPGQWKLLCIKKAVLLWRYWLFVQGTGLINNGTVYAKAAFSKDDLKTYCISKKTQIFEFISPSWILSVAAHSLINGDWVETEEQATSQKTR